MLELSIATVLHSWLFDHCCPPRYGAEAGLWSSGAQLVQPVDTTEHDGRTHAAVLEAVNRDGFAEHDPNPVYSAQFQSTSEQGTLDAAQAKLAATSTNTLQVEDDTGVSDKGAEKAYSAGDSTEQPLLSETSHDNIASTLEETVLPTPILRGTATVADTTTTSSAADTATGDEGEQVSRTFSTPPSNSRHGAHDDGGSAVLPAASSPLFEPQAALLHTVRASRPVHLHFSVNCFSSLLPGSACSDAGSSRRSSRDPGCQLHAAASV